MFQDMALFLGQTSSPTSTKDIIKISDYTLKYHQITTG